jgi:isocitrate dehydrogenase kinase/phosphatase
MAHHAELLTRDFWQGRKQRIMDGLIEDVFPYPQKIRFCNQASAPPVPTTPAALAPPGFSSPYLENLHNE